VRLIRKMAHQLDGVDISGHSVGECFELPAPEAGLLVAEGWAVVEPTANAHSPTAFGDHEAVEPGERRRHDDPDLDLTLARTLERVRELRAGIEQRRQTTEFERRRAEDVIREELRDSRAVTVRP